MIVKERGKHIELERLQALLRRLHQTHHRREVVENDLKRKNREVKGEQQVDYPLRFLEDNRNIILHNVRIADANGYFQIDTLILTEKYLLILEVKNWYGTILFGENGQVTRVGDSQKEEGFLNPVVQVKMQQHRLRQWLHSMGYPDIPLKYLVIISHPSTIIKSISTKNFIPNEVIHSNQLFFRIQALNNKFNTIKLGMDHLIHLSQKVVAAHVPANQNLLFKYDLTVEELLKGVICQKCGSIPMIRKKNKWLCVMCNYTSMSAHFSALNDYILLIGDSITNRKARDFLQLESPYVAKRILLGANPDVFGNKSKRVYTLKMMN